MPSPHLLRFGKGFLGIGALCLCLFVFPRPASADSADVITLTVQGTWLELSCSENNQFIPYSGPCLPEVGSVGQTGPMTGSFDFDPDTLSVVSSPVFLSTPFGGFSPAAQTTVTEQTTSAGTFFEFDFFAPLCCGNPDLAGDSFYLSYGPGPSGGTISAYLTAVPGYYNITSTWELLSGTAFVAPEPSSLLLFGTGLLGLGPLLRRHLRLL